MKIHKNIRLDTSKFNRYFKKAVYIVKDTGEIIDLYISNYYGINIKYNPISLRLSIEGRLIKLSDYNNRVNNLDVLLKTGELDSVIDKLNTRIMELIGKQKNIDVRYFKISHIEICFNFKTKYVNEYISLFNSIFLINQKYYKKFKRHKNLIIEEDKPDYTSFHVTTKSQYEKKTKVNYTVNFYNKADQLKSLIKKSKEDPKYKYVKVTENDLMAAENILRLEVQCSYQYLRHFKKKFNIDADDRILKTFIYDIDLCKKIIIDKYSYFLDNNIYNNFYSYEKAKEIITNSDKQVFERSKKKVLGYLQSLSQYSVYKQYKSHNTRKPYNNILDSHFISQYFVDKNFKIDVLGGLNYLFINSYTIDTTQELINKINTNDNDTDKFDDTFDDEEPIIKSE